MGDKSVVFDRGAKTLSVKFGKDKSTGFGSRSYPSGDYVLRFAGLKQVKSQKGPDGTQIFTVPQFDVREGPKGTVGTRVERMLAPPGTKSKGGEFYARGQWLELKGAGLAIELDEETNGIDWAWGEDVGTFVRATVTNTKGKDKDGNEKTYTNFSFRPYDDSDDDSSSDDDDDDGVGGGTGGGVPRGWNVKYPKSPGTCREIQIEDQRPVAAIAILYVWNFGDGSVTTTTKGLVNHTYETEGVYTVKVRVQYTSGFIDAATIRVNARGVECLFTEFANDFFPLLFGLVLLMLVSSIVVLSSRRAKGSAKRLLLNIFLGTALVAVTIMVLTVLYMAWQGIRP